MITNTLQHGSYHLRFGGVQFQTEEHTAGIGIFKGTAVAVKPGGKDQTVGTGGYLLGSPGQKGIGISFCRCFTAVIVQCVFCQMGLGPFQTFACGFHLGKIIEFVRLCADDGSNHGGHIHHLFGCYGNDPAGSAPVDMGSTRGHTTCADTNKAGVTATAVDTGTFHKTQLSGSL